MEKSKSEFVVETYQNNKLIYEADANKCVKVDNNFPPLVREFSREGLEFLTGGSKNMN